MPTYQYVCTACASPLEAQQSFSDAPLTVCPVCEGRLRKVFSAVGVVFKGSGFYRTDSRTAADGSGSNGDGRDGSGDTSGDKSGEKSGDKAGDKSGEKSGTTSGGGKAARTGGSGDATSGSGGKRSSGASAA